MNFSDKIKFQREQNHLTQKELAELVGVSQRAIAAYESSGTIARISTMRKLAHALNVSYDYLKHDEITDPSYGIEKMDYIDEVNGQLGEKGVRSGAEVCGYADRFGRRNRPDGAGVFRHAGAAHGQRFRHGRSGRAQEAAGGCVR